MSKFIFIFISSISIFVSSCKPAAEDRIKMHEKANRISDSIGKMIDSALEEVKIEPKSSVDTTKK